MTETPVAAPTPLDSATERHVAVDLFKRSGLDFEAQKVAGDLGMKMVRAATAGTHPAFVRMVRELVMERIEDRVPENICAPDCCRIS